MQGGSTPLTPLPDKYSPGLRVCVHLEFVIAAPRRSSLSYDASTGHLTLQATAVYCVKVDVVRKHSAAGVWTNYAACLNASTGTVVVVPRQDVADLRVAFCLPRRFDVCSRTVSATQGRQTLPCDPNCSGTRFAKHLKTYVTVL